MSQIPDKGVTVIVPVFNRENLISETIQSVLSQTNPNWELLLIDDGSSDSSVEICKNYASEDERIHFFERKTDKKGASVCRNIGILNAKYSHVIFLDSDDILASWCIENRLKKLDSDFSEYEMLIFPMLYFKQKPGDSLILQNINTEMNPLERFLNLENVWLMSSVLWNLSFLKKLGGYNEDASSFQDWEMNVRALSVVSKIHFFDKETPDNFYRQHEFTISANRFSEEQLSNNVYTFISVFKFILNGQVMSDKIRSDFGKIIYQWLSRFFGLKIPGEKRKQLLDKLIIESVNGGIYTSQEGKVLIKYFNIMNNPIYFRFKTLSKWRTSSYLKWIQKFQIQDNFIKNQGKHVYHGKLFN